MPRAARERRRSSGRVYMVLRAPYRAVLQHATPPEALSRISRGPIALGPVFSRLVYKPSTQEYNTSRFHCRPLSRSASFGPFRSFVHFAPVSIKRPACVSERSFLLTRKLWGLGTRRASWNTYADTSCERADELENGVPAISRCGKRSFQFARNVLHGDVNTTLRDSRLVRFASSTLSDVISGPECTAMLSSAAMLKTRRVVSGFAHTFISILTSSVGI